MQQRPQPDDLAEVVIETTSGGAAPAGRRRGIDDAWEAVVREELTRLRRRHARDRRFTRPGATVPPSRPPAGGDLA